MSFYYIQPIFFFSFTFLAIFFSFLVIFSKNPIHSVLFLVFVFFNSSGLILLIGVEFLALLYLIVYVGAVAVLFLFVIMMLNIKISRSFKVSLKHLIAGSFLGLSFLFEVCFIVNSQLAFYDFFLLFPQSHLIEICLFLDWFSFLQISNQDISALGSVLYTHFFIHFILSSIILFISMIGAIVLTLHKRYDVKKQHVFKQLNRNFTSSTLFFK